MVIKFVIYNQYIKNYNLKKILNTKKIRIKEHKQLFDIFYKKNM